MFIRETYARRVRKQEQESGEESVMAKKGVTSKIGSINNNKVNYDREEQFFSKEDVPLHARTIKQEVKDFIDPDFLGLRKKSWNTSVSVPRKFEDEESHERKLTKIRHGLFDHPIPTSTIPKIYDGTERRDDYTGWQVSTEVTKKQLVERNSRITEEAKRNTKSVEKFFLGNYETPIEKSKKLIETHHNKEVVESQLRSTLKEEYKYLNPDASEEKTNATVFRLAYETGLAVMKQELIKNNPATVSQKPFKANLTQTLREKVVDKQFHNGIWQLFRMGNRQEPLEYYAWSCCMNQEHDSKGCITKKVDGNRWNFTSFNA